MENIERQLVRINNSINNIYSTMNVLSNSLLIQQTNTLIDSLRNTSRNSPSRPRQTSLFTTPSPPAPPQRTSTRTLSDILGQTSATRPTPQDSSVASASPAPASAPAPAPAPTPTPTPPPAPANTSATATAPPQNRRRREDSELFNSLFSSLMSNDFGSMEVSLLGVAPPPLERERNIVVSHHNIFTNTKVSIKTYDNYDNDDNDDSESELEKCTICQDYIRNNSIVRQINKCKHTFHVECADRWFQDNIKCPHCRQDIRENVN